jgi:hypothetical protein
VLTPLTYPVRSSNRFELEQLWPPLAQSNPMFLHGMIAVAATVQAMRNGEPIQLDLQHRIEKKKLGLNAIDSLLHQAEAVRLVNMRLSDPTEASSDAMLTVVTLLAASEVSRRLLCLLSKTLL